MLPSISIFLNGVSPYLSNTLQGRPYAKEQLANRKLNPCFLYVFVLIIFVFLYVFVVYFYFVTSGTEYEVLWIGI